MSSSENQAPDKPQSPQPAAADLRKRVRAKMAAVLQATQGLKEADASKQVLDKASRAALQQFKMLAVPATEDDQVVRDYLTECNKRYRAFCEARAALDRALAAYFDAKRIAQTSPYELEEVVALAEACEGLAHDESVKAARYLVDRLKPRSGRPPESPSSASGAHQDSQAAMPNDERKKLDAALSDATFAAARNLARCWHLAPVLSAAVDELDKTAKPSVNQPVRPTEEEVQRYLRQSEDATSARLRAHRAASGILPVRAALLLALKESQDVLVQLLKTFDKTSDAAYNHESAAALATARLISKSWQEDGDKLSPGFWADYPLDKINKATASSRETRQLAELRALMRTLAYAIAHRNEARKTLNALVPAADKFISSRSLETCQTWADCLALQEDDRNDAERVKLEHKSYLEKRDLLRELLVQYQAEIDDARKALRRYVIVIKPPQQRPPCDELRVLMNAAAWMCDEDNGGTGEGSFPIY